MLNRYLLSSRRSALATALGLALNATQGGAAGPSLPDARSITSPHSAVLVTKCTDDGTTGTLRYELAHAPNAATIDLSTLTCSKITLDSQQGQIMAMQDFIYLKGPTDHELTIDAAFNSRVLAHVGAARIEISDLTLANGYNSIDGSSLGGCIFSENDIVLTRSKVTNCSVFPSTSYAYGGGVAAFGDLFLYDSVIEKSYAYAPLSRNAYGGGAFVSGDLRAFNSMIDSNSANGNGIGGGAYVKGSLTSIGSTVSRNYASLYAGGIFLKGFGAIHTITSSTISQNEAGFEYGGVWADNPLNISNSTIAFNRAAHSDFGRYSGIQLFVGGLTIQSSIVANNTGAGSTPSDLGGIAGAAISLTSAKNLITSSNLTLPADTIKKCARLQPLANNGGKTLTHALSAASPAIDKGDAGSLTTDQRGAPRIVNGVADIGAVERQSGEIDDRLLANGFDELCYQ